VSTEARGAPERVLEVSNLSVSYGAIQALTGVSLHLDEGEIVT
jgi:branched-chain amino acid transport system ATP-binding protein